MRSFVPFVVLVVLITPLHMDAQTIAAGRMIEVKLEREVTTKSARVGDTVTALLPEGLKDGKDVVIPAGSRLQGRVDFVQRKTVSSDGWMRLLFNRVELQDGRSIQTLASGSFAKGPRRGTRDRILAVAGFATLGALLGGKVKRVAGALGGAIIGLVIVENRLRYGRDLTLRAGKTIELRLSNDLVLPGE